jgi:hypothetical protein
MIVTGICISYKREILKGLHSQSHTYKMALFTSLANLDKNTTSYLNQTGEIAAALLNGYETGGKELTGFSVVSIGNKAMLDFNSPVEWLNSNIIARGALIYNNSLTDKNSVAVLDFGADLGSVNDTFGIKFPAPGVDTSLIRIN